MNENCNDGCRALSKVEQELQDLRERNGSDHKQFREDIRKIELNGARQEAKLDNITSSITELKVDNRKILDGLGPLTAKMEQLQEVSGDVDELKAKPAKTWEDIKSKAIGWIVAAVLAVLAFAMGLKQYM